MAILARLGATAVRACRVQARRQAHDHHEIVNPGPPITLDYMPIPCQPYGVVYNELQSKFNRYLAISAAFFVGAFALVSALPPPLDS